MESWVRHAKTNNKKRQCAFTLTEVNVTKGTTSYLSPEPVLVPHSELHGCDLSLSPTDKKDMIIGKQRTHDTMLAHPGCASFLTTNSETL